MIRLIAAVDIKNGIAKNGIQPWKLPLDEKYFELNTKTYGANILMGYKTYQVIGHTLSGRINYIVSREHQGEEIEGAILISDLSKFINDFSKDIWVIGGAQIYSQTIDRADEVYLTKIDKDFGCDQFFPRLPRKFKLIFAEGKLKENDLTFNYNLYKRV